ncbi:hypothetical protein HWV62_40711 [Athelia sp. TMB]|nr:hypothetical protein HWV62_40711 [Athelia sp. TMB]
MARQSHSKNIGNLLPDLPLELLLEVRDAMHSDKCDGAPAGRELQKCARNTLKIMAAVNRTISEKILPFYLSLQGLIWTPSDDDKQDLGTFNIHKDAFQALGMLRRSNFFQNMLAEILDAHRANRHTRHLKLICNINDYSTTDVALADARALARIDVLASFLESLPSSQQIFEWVDAFIPERTQIASHFWRKILPLCHTRNIHIWSYASPSTHDDTSAALALAPIHLPLLQHLYVGHLAFSQAQWLDALAMNTTFPHHSIDLPGLRTLYGCQDRVAQLIGQIDSKATIKNIYLDSAHGSYRSWVEGVLRCIPSQEISSLAIRYVGPVANAEAGNAGARSVPSRLDSEILPRRLRRYEQSQLGYMSITLSNMSEQDAQAEASIALY